MDIVDRRIYLNTDNTLPGKYWIYVWGILAIFFAFSYVAFMPEGLGVAVLMSIVVAVFFTAWLILVHLLWFEGSLLLKILALIFGGLFAVIFVIIIQFAYEKLILKKAI